MDPYCWIYKGRVDRRFYLLAVVSVGEVGK